MGRFKATEVTSPVQQHFSYEILFSMNENLQLALQDI